MGAASHDRLVRTDDDFHHPPDYRYSSVKISLQPY